MRPHECEINAFPQLAPHHLQQSGELVLVDQVQVIRPKSMSAEERAPPLILCEVALSLSPHNLQLLEELILGS